MILQKLFKCSLIILIILTIVMSISAQSNTSNEDQIMPVFQITNGKNGQVAWISIAPYGSNLNIPGNQNKMIGTVVQPINIKGECSGIAVNQTMTPVTFSPYETYEINVIIDSNFNFNPFTGSGIDDGDMIYYIESITFEEGVPVIIDLEAEGVQQIPGTSKIIYDRHKRYQRIQGFGAFGLRDVNWMNPEEWWTDEWGEMIINDLGLTITRNEWYPPAIEGEIQDTNWEIQKPYIQKLHAMAKKHKKPLKQVVSIYSPPAHMKDNGSTKWGGKLLPEYYEEFGYYLVECLDAYKEAGIDVYAISPQNEPIAVVNYNSGFYTPQEYVEMIKVAAPIVKNHYPRVKIMGPESMIWETWDWSTSFEKTIMDDCEAFDLIDIFATHLYTWDYQFTASDPDMERKELENFYNRLKRKGKLLWMTEVCGWNKDWNDGLKMGQSIYNSLYHGNMSAWIHWTLSAGPWYENFILMAKEEKFKKYYAAKHFYNYIRPGSRRIESFSTNEDILALAVKSRKNKLTFVVINKSKTPCTITLTDITREKKGYWYCHDDFESNGYNVIFTDKDNNCVELAPLGPDQNTILIPPESIITLQGK